MRATQKVSASIGASTIGAKFADTPFTPYMPVEPLVSAPHLTEHVPIAPITGAFQPSGRPRYELPLEVDLISKLNFRIRLQRLGNTGGTYGKFISFNDRGQSTFYSQKNILTHVHQLARYINWIGLYCWSEIRIKYGTETLQKIHPDEIFCKIQKRKFCDVKIVILLICFCALRRHGRMLTVFYKIDYNDEERANLARLLGGNLTPAQRSSRALHEQEILIPVLTCLNMHLYGPPSGAFFIRGLGEKVIIEVDLRPFDQWVCVLFIF